MWNSPFHWCRTQATNHGVTSLLTRSGQTKSSQFFSYFAENSRAQKPTKVWTKRANITVVTLQSFLFLTGGGVKFIFYRLSYLNFIFSIFAPASIFASFHQARYQCRCLVFNCNCVYVFPVGASLQTFTLIPHPTIWVGLGPLPFLAVPWWETEMYPLFRSDHCRSAVVDTPS